MNSAILVVPNQWMVVECLTTGPKATTISRLKSAGPGFLLITLKNLIAKSNFQLQKIMLCLMRLI